MTAEELTALLSEFIGGITDEGIEEMEIYRLACFIVAKFEEAE